MEAKHLWVDITYNIYEWKHNIQDGYQLQII